VPETVLASALLEALPYVNYFAGKTVVVKLGGSTLPQQDTALQDVVLLRKLGVIPVIVHGGGAEISSWLKKVGIQSRFHKGLRVTDEPTMEVVKMVLIGKVNPELVAIVNGLGAYAIGMSGIDGRLMEVVKDDTNGDIGLVGRVVNVNTGVIKSVIEAGLIPVIAPIGIGSDGQAYNLNADTAAGELAAALAAEKLIFLTDVPGVCDSTGALQSELTESKAIDLIEQGVIEGGMIPKVRACLIALRATKHTHIISGTAPHSIIRELFTKSGVGTMITPDQEEEYAPAVPVQDLLRDLGGK
jgi:acetylglutamate kinase